MAEIAHVVEARARVGLLGDGQRLDGKVAGLVYVALLQMGSSQAGEQP